MNRSMELIEKHEGRRHKVYRCSKNKLTVGVGHNINDNGLSEENIRYLLNTNAHYADTNINTLSRETSIGLDLESVVFSEYIIDKMFEEDYRISQKTVARIHPRYSDFSKSLIVVLENMAFQLGHSRFAKFKRMHNAIRQPNLILAAEEMKDSKWFREDTPERAQELIDIILYGY